LTDFEGLKVFNAQIIDRKLTDKLYFEILSNQYVERFDQLWLLSKGAFEENLIDKEAEKVGKKIQRVSVGISLYKDLTLCRDILTDKLGKMNPGIDSELLDEGVQKLLDRLIFIRVAEDRGIEPPTLIPLIRAWKNSKNPNEIPLYKSMVSKFRELDETYNSNLFTKHPLEDWEDWSNITEQVVKILQGKPGYYEYDFKAIPSDVLGSVYENYLGYRLSKSKKGLTLSKDAKKRKEHGIYYTPDYIVDYIVKNALKPVLDKCNSVAELKKIKVLDPACGSGSFLIKAMDLIYKKYEEFGNRGGTYTKLAILLDNIYGVDLDPQAVEIARLNLLLNILEEKIKLPLLDKNIKNGNSLISGTDEELKRYFGENFRDKKPFNWQEEFPEVFKQGGFDVIIGNPPYISFYSRESHLDQYIQDVQFLTDKYELTQIYSDRRLNTVMFFIERSLQILRAHGNLGFVIDANFLEKPFRALRSWLVEKKFVVKISQKFSAFNEVASDQNLLFVKKSKSELPFEVLSFDGNVGNFTNSKIKVLSEKFKEDVVNLNPKKINLYKVGILPLKELALVSTGVQIGIGGTRAYDGQNIEKLFYSESKKSEKHFENISLNPKDFFQYCPPKTKNYLNLDEKLASKINRNVKKCNIAVTKAKPFINKEKIFVRQSSSSIVATVGQPRQISEYSAFMIRPFQKHDTHFILAILNSKPMTLYAKEENVILMGNKKQPQIRLKGLKKLPFPVVGVNPKRSLASKARVMLHLNNKLLKVQENSEKWNYIKSEIEKTDNKIDEEVYKLYNLTAKEIEIVEKS